MTALTSSSIHLVTRTKEVMGDAARQFPAPDCQAGDPSFSGRLALKVAGAGKGKVLGSKYHQGG